MTEPGSKPAARRPAHDHPRSRLGRTIGTTLAAFLATLALLVGQMASGRDPALRSINGPAVRLASTSGGGVALRTSASGASATTAAAPTQSVQSASIVTRTSGGLGGRRDDG